MQSNSSGFEAVFRANYDDLLRFALRRVGPDAACDVVADVFLVAWRRRAEIPGDAARLWLYGVAGNVIANERRGQLRRARLASRAAAQPLHIAPDHSEAVAAGSEVRSALGALPEHEQEALRLTEWEQLSIPEAAAVAECSPATFRVRLHRARRRLAAELAAVDPGYARTEEPAACVQAEDPVRTEDVVA